MRLNEVALIPDSVPHMNEFEIYIDDQFVCSQDSDGVIVATPPARPLMHFLAAAPFCTRNSMPW